MFEDKEHKSLIRMIQRIPGEKPPEGFADKIVGTLRPKNLPLWKKVYRKALTPRTVTFTPAGLIPAAAVALILVSALVLKIGMMRTPATAPEANGMIPVTFTLADPGANKIHVIGSFNNWNPHTHEMTADRQTNVWMLTLRLPKGQHEYAFLIDGKRAVPDPKAAISREDGFGSRNSVLFAYPNNETLL